MHHSNILNSPEDEAFRTKPRPPQYSFNIPPSAFRQDQLLTLAAQVQDLLTQHDRCIDEYPHAALCMAALTLEEAVYSTALAGLSVEFKEVMYYTIDPHRSNLSPLDVRAASSILSYRNALPALIMSRTCPEINLKLIGDFFVSLQSPQLVRFKGYESELNLWLQFIDNQDIHPLLKLALLQSEFYRLQPAALASGRLVRQLTVIAAWHLKVMRHPALYLSRQFCNSGRYHKQFYSSYGAGINDWCEYFLRQTAITMQANTAVLPQLEDLYRRLQAAGRNAVSDKIFQPFAAAMFKNGGISSPLLFKHFNVARNSVRLFLDSLVDAGLFSEQSGSSGSRPAKYVFTALLDVLSARWERQA